MPPGTRRRSCSTATRTERVDSGIAPRIPVQLFELGAAAGPREATDPGLRLPRSGGSAAVSSSKQRSRAPARPSGSSGSTSRAPSPEDLGQRPHRGGHDGDAGPHGLEGREAESLVTRGVGEDVRTAEQRGQLELARPSPCGRCGHGPATRPARPAARPLPNPRGRPGPGPHRGGATQPEQRRARARAGPCAVPPSRWPGSSAPWRRGSGAGAPRRPRPRPRRGDRAPPVRRCARGRGRPRRPPPPRPPRTLNRCAPTRRGPRPARIRPG